MSTIHKALQLSAETRNNCAVKLEEPSLSLETRLLLAGVAKETLDEAQAAKGKNINSNIFSSPLLM